MPRRGYNAFRSYRTRRVRRSSGTRRRVHYNPNAAVFVPSWLKSTVKSSVKVVSNGINSLLREINTKRRRSLGERKSR